jgi:sec-independent protein translocase protein TatA
MTLGVVEILLVFLVFVVLGPRRIVDLLRSAGRGIHDFVDNLGQDAEQRELERGPDDETRSPK